MQTAVFNAPHTNTLTPGEGLYQAVDPEWAGDQALVAWMSDGLRVVDVSDRSAPKAGPFYVPPAVQDPSGHYPTVPLVVGVARFGSRAVISDINGGLYVLDLTGSPGPGGPGTGGGGSGGGGGAAASGGGGAQSGGGPAEPVRGSASEARRARLLRQCLAKARRSKGKRSRKGRGSRKARQRARRRARRACLKRYGRTPGRVTGLQARAVSSTEIQLSFDAPGTDGSRPPPARSYLIKQSLRPIRSRRDFARGQELCNGSCRFSVTDVGARLTLSVADLSPNTTFHYSVAARDNVSGRLGPRSASVSGKTP